MEYKIGTDARCAVIGYGSWATAIVGLLAANGRRVGWYVRNPEVLESLCSDGRNPRYLNDLEFDRNSIAPSSDLDAVVRDADIVILATPSAYLKDFLAPLTVPLRDKFVVSAIKGIVRHVILAEGPFSKVSDVEVKHLFVGNEDQGLRISCNVVLTYGNHIPTLLKQAQEKVTSHVEFMTGMIVHEVDIVVKTLYVRA